mmetsp:Transcript_26608/g.48760  ORF Transcript_26608/g.48760 Transcript_26608/m.48760 type:complete len:174 (-) Transcript_26608:77-598(-)
MLAAHLRSSLRPLARRSFAPVAVRTFAASPLEATEKSYSDFVEKSVAMFKASEKDVTANLDAELAKNKAVLFMEGTPDAPKSELSLNMVKMLTQVQMVPFLAIDVLAHPAILGYTVSKSARKRAPHLYLDGSFYADHDGILAKYKSGELKSLGTSSTLSTGSAFGGELPVAMY